MVSIRGLFFDLDGTLVNTYEADFLAYRDAINEVTGYIVSREAFMTTNGMEMKEKLKILVPTIKPNQFDHVAQRKKKYYPQYLHKTVPNKTLIAFLSDLAKDHITALVTTAKRQNAEAVLAAYNLTDVFDYTVYGDDVTNAKPHPESYLKALSLASLSAEEVLAFEDSRSGIEAAHAAGIKTIQIQSFS